MEYPKTRLMLEVGINATTLKMDLENTLCGLSVREVMLREPKQTQAGAGL
jgi:hypothetical protein